MPNPLGSVYALPFVKLLYNPEASNREIAEISSCVILCIEKLEVDQSVGGLPDAVIIEDKNKEPVLITEQEMNALVNRFNGHYEQLKATLRGLLSQSDI